MPSTAPGPSRGSSAASPTASSGCWSRTSDSPAIYFDLAAVSVVDHEVSLTITEVNEGWRRVLTRLFEDAEEGLTRPRPGPWR